MFKKTNQHRIYQDLVDQIEAAIFDGRLKTGDKLPSQRELVEMFETSRGPLREALRVLELKGLIDIKLGVSGGAVVKAPDEGPVTESLALLIRHKQISINELSEFREGVEGNAAALAAEKASQDTIKVLKNLLLKARPLVDKGVSCWKSFCQVDNDIHVAIANASGNRVYAFVLRMVHDNIQHYYEAHPLKEKTIMEENYQDLCDIIAAMEKQNSTVVRSLMQSHVRRFNRYMVQKQHETTEITS